MASRWTTILGIDFGVRDMSAFAVLRWREFDSVVYIAECYGRSGMGPSDVAEEYKDIARKYELQQTVADVGGMGLAFTHEMSTRHNIPIVPAAKQNKQGYIALMNSALRDGKIKVVGPLSKQLIEQWTNVPWNEAGTREAEGYPCDCLDAALYGWRATIAFLEQPEPVLPAPGTPDAWKREAEEDLERHIAKLNGERDRAERWDESI